MREVVGSVKALWRFPVKSMRGERLEAAELTEHGFVGDRVYALIDCETGRVVSGKTPRLGPSLLRCRAAFIETPTVGEAPPPVEITLADGSAVTTEARNVDAVLSRFLGREVRLERAAPDDVTIGQSHPDVDGLDPAGHRDTVTQTKLEAAPSDEIGVASPVPAGAFFDFFPCPSCRPPRWLGSPLFVLKVGSTSGVSA